MKLERIDYPKLNARQKENFNFQKIAAKLADYGYYCMWLNDDWQGADFIAIHIDGIEFFKIQLKGRLTINKKYVDKDIYITFRYDNETYLYPHDEVMDLIFRLLPNKHATSSWREKGGFSWPNPVPKKIKIILELYRI